MNVKWRTGLFVVSLTVLVPAIWRLACALPPFGALTSDYGETVNELIPAARHITNMVAAVNFDIRGVDTLGEECILVCAVTGAVVLLRGARGENLSAKAVHLPGRPIAQRTDATVLLCRAAATITFLFGIYMMLHGTTTPGGGFQGGAITASSFTLLYLGEGYRMWRRLLPGSMMDVLEGGGAFIFVGCASLPLAFGFSALENVLPYGRSKDLFAGGLIVVTNLAVAVSVVGSFAMLLLEFMGETRAPEDDAISGEQPP
jgi:multicomponent Na+:H+ antiporter subunit B